jgi:hypothetical protein
VIRFFIYCLKNIEKYIYIYIEIHIKIKTKLKRNLTEMHTEIFNVLQIFFLASYAINIKIIYRTLKFQIKEKPKLFIYRIKPREAR